MARPEKNSVDYFPYICSEGEKMYYLEETYGNDGFATFVKILIALAKTEYHYLNLSKTTTLMFLSAKCKISKDILESIIKDLVDLGKFDSELWNENKIIWCQDFIDSIQDAYNKRKNKCITYEGLLLLLISLGIRKPLKSKPKVPVKPQSIVEYSKVDKSIVEESREDEATFTSAIDILKLLDDISEENITEMTELTLFKGDLKELKQKFSVEFVGRYGLNKKEKEVIAAFQSWMHKDKNYGIKKEDANASNDYKLDLSKLK